MKEREIGSESESERGRVRVKGREGEMYRDLKRKLKISFPGYCSSFDSTDISHGKKALAHR